MRHLQVDVTDHCPCLQSGPCDFRAGLIVDTLQIERIGRHRQLAGAGHAPFRTGLIAVDLDPQSIRIVQVQRLAHQVIGGAGDRPLLFRQMTQRSSERSTRRDEDREMKQAGAATRFRNRILVLVQLDQDPPAS